MDIITTLRSSAEPVYGEFIKKLTPGAGNVLGVRMPRLRSLSKEILRSDWRAFLSSGSDFYEVQILRALVIAGAKCPLEEKLRMTEAFVPTINNWAVCDAFCGAFKDAAKYPDVIWDFILPYTRSPREFEARFAAVMLLCHFVDSEHVERVLGLLNSMRQDDYYAMMGVAWAVSECYARFPGLTEEWLTACGLGRTAFNKSIQKICESNRVDPETKARLKKLKRE
ncbi:MAG: DNA alkylation repair protein [Oscillospiraceae bacterium]|jgi:3-methyladenine DNA glycosylase AlkD